MKFRKIKLSEIASVQTGPFGSQLHKKDYVDDGIPIITVEHLGENKILHQNLPLVGDEDYNRLAKYHLQKNDIVFSRVGSVDRRALVSEKEDGWMFSGRCLRVRVFDIEVNPIYLSYYFGTSSFKEYIRSIAVGATMPSINTKILSDIEIFLPPLEIQNRVSEILNRLDTKIWLNEESINKLDEICSLLYKRWFIDFEFPNEQGLPYRSSGMKMVESELGDIPKDWSIYNLGEFAESISKSINIKDVQYARFLNTSDIEQGRIKKVDLTLTSEMPGQAKKLIQKGDILYSEIRPKNKRYAYVNFECDDYVVSTKLMVIRVNENIYSNKLLYMWLTQEETINTLQQIAEDRSGTFPQITFSILSNFKFVLPNRNKLKEFEDVLTPFLDKILVLQQENEKLSVLRDTLLPKILLGEIEISDESVVERS